MTSIHFAPAHRCALTALALSALVLGCGEASSTTTLLAPTSAEKLIVNPLVTRPAFTRETALTTDLHAYAHIGRGGGSFGIPTAGIRVTVPAGAVTRPTWFVVRAKAGRLIAYDFAPHGAVFPVPLEVKQSLRGTSWWRLSDAGRTQVPVTAGYFASDSQLDFVNNLGTFTEILDASVDLTNVFASFHVHHFSGYAMVGRTSVR